MSTQAKDLTKEAPASPANRVGGYVILARLADKARADFMGGKIGEYHTDCPLDHMLLDWKGVPYADIKTQIVGGAEDDALAKFLDGAGTTKSPEEIKAWSDSMEAMNPFYNPERKEWYAEQCGELGLDPPSTPMFKWLEEGDKNPAS